MIRTVISASLGIVSIEMACLGEPGAGLDRISSKVGVA
jgi:hypothetical protein